MTPAERLRKHQRALEKTQRELDRERVKLENQEKKLVADIKKSAKNGQIGACKIQAKDLVRTRRYIQKFYQMRTQLQAISLRIQVGVLSPCCSPYYAMLINRSRVPDSTK
jgi:charged multivesicular body protein 2A